jgi:hypothetical protein
VEGKGFTIPDLPEATLRWDTTVALEPEMGPVTIQLPPARSGAAWCMNLSGGDPRPMSREEACSFVDRVLKEGGAIWILDNA